jgi:hypothetical protein
MLVGTGNQQPTNRQPRGSRVSRYSTGTIHAVPAPKLVDQVNSTYNKPAPASLGSVDTGTLPVRYRYATGTLPVRYRYATGTLPVPKSRLVNQVNSTYNKPAPASLGSVNTGTLPVPESRLFDRVNSTYLQQNSGQSIPVSYMPYRCLGFCQVNNIYSTTNQPPRVSGVDTGTVPVRFVTVPLCFKNFGSSKSDRTVEHPNCKG